MSKRSRSAEPPRNSSAKQRKAWARRLHDQQLRNDECPIDLLPDVSLILIFEKAVFPGRLAAAQVCKRWRQVANDARFTHQVDADCPTITDVIELARPGDTILVPSGMYQETVLADKPLKFIGLPLSSDGHLPTQPVVLYAMRPPVVLCNARFEDCRFNGQTGLHLPYKKGSNTKLLMIECLVTGARQGLAGLMVMTGSLHMLGCTIEHNSIGIEIGKGAAAEIRDCTLAFNNTALMIDGSALLADNRIWGNNNLGCCGTQERLQRALVSQVPPTPTTPAEARRPLYGATPDVLQALKRFHRALRKGEDSFVVLRNTITAVERGLPMQKRNTRKKAKALAAEVYPAPDVDADAPGWDLELLAASDLDSDEGDDEGDGGQDWAEDEEDAEEGEDDWEEDNDGDSSGSGSDESDEDSSDESGSEGGGSEDEPQGGPHPLQAELGSEDEDEDGDDYEAGESEHSGGDDDGDSEAGSDQEGGSEDE